MTELTDAVAAGDADAARARAVERPELKAVRDEQGLLPAILALYSGNEALAQELTPDEEHLRPYEAAALGRIDRLRALLEEDRAHAQEPSPDGFTPLHGACYVGDADAARLLIEHGADLDALADHEFIRVRPLGTAAFARSRECIVALLDAGADPNGQGEGGFTALHTAASNGSGDIVQVLLDRGADPAAALPDGRTPEALARAEGHADVAGAIARAAG